MSQQPAHAIAVLLPLQQLIDRIVRATPIGATDQLAANLAVHTAAWVGKNVLPVLTPAERQFLTFALDLAADHMADRGDEFTAEDDAALDRLRQLAEGELRVELGGQDVTLHIADTDAVKAAIRKIVGRGPEGAEA